MPERVGEVLPRNGRSERSELPGIPDSRIPKTVEAISPAIYVEPNSPATLPDINSDSPVLADSTTCVTQVDDATPTSERYSSTSDQNAVAEAGVGQYVAAPQFDESLDQSKNDEPPADVPTSIGPIAEREFATEASSDRIQSEIRSTISSTLQLGDRYGSVKASAIALACHPWPDESVRENIRDAIAAELLPGFNINHPSLEEIAADRLLRIAEALTFECAKDLLLRFTEAASVLTGESEIASSDGDVFTRHVPHQGIVSSPWGLTQPLANQQDRMPIESESSAEDVSDSDQWQSLIHGLLGGVCLHESHDIGVICGGGSADVTVDELADHLGVELPENVFDNFLNELSSRKLDILKTRSYKLRNPDTLVEVATRWDVTRERVRQIEMKATERLRNEFADVFKEVGRQALSPFQDRVAKASDLHGVALAIAERSQYREALAAFLLELFGPWNTKGGWAVHRSIADEVASLQEKLTSDTDQYGFLNDERIETLCEHLFFDAEERNQYLTEVVGLGFSFGNWTSKQTLRCEVASAIRKIGRPATKEEIADLLGHPVQRVGSMMGNLEGVVRADRYRWGFSEWIDDAYDGIVGEIEQRIDAYNGSVPVHILLTEIPSQFDVAEGSVRAYLASSAFVVESDMVRRANDEEYVARHPE
ncbi:hypothetical protein N9B79_00350, partial [bacterium]|nr:hypothetical protein [bacterium]